MVRVVLHYGPTSIFILSTHLEIQALKHGNKTDFLMLDPVLNTPEKFTFTLTTLEATIYGSIHRVEGASRVSELVQTSDYTGSLKATQR